MEKNMAVVYIMATTLSFDSANFNQYILEHSFPTKTFFPTDVSKSTNKYSATFTNSQPNLHYKKAGITENYIATSISVYPTLHSGINRLNSDIVGEMVVTLSSTTNNAECYLCFLLKKSMNVADNNIDNFLSLCNGTTGVLNADLNIDSFFSGNCISYADTKTKTVLIIENPITLNNASSGLSIFGSTATIPSGMPFSYSSTQTYSLIDSENISKINSGEIYIDCQPSGASASEIATYEVPINSEYTKEASNLKYMNMIMHFAFFFIVLVICSIGVPLLYTRTVINQIHSLYNINTTKSDAATERNIMVDWLLLFLMFFIIIILAAIGNFAGATILTIFIALSSSIITMYRQNNDKYKEYFNEDLNFPWWRGRYNDFVEIVNNCCNRELFFPDPNISLGIAGFDLIVIIVILLPILMQNAKYKPIIVNVWYPIALFFFALFTVLPYGRIKTKSK